ncbi:MAG TPA: hypothetical protein PKA00_06820 [Saprospiraceae bacterium]|nr:hypothetical protein [Saprospiraceae bacterium]HMQ82600.1 hypothetical protein [Saprospiraceae bacterium]
MKYYHLLLLFLLTISLSCGQNKSKAGQSQSEAETTSEPQPEQAPEKTREESMPTPQEEVTKPAENLSKVQQLAFKPTQRMLSSGKVQFIIDNPAIHQLKITPSGLEVRNEPMEKTVDGTLEDAFITDLDKDGFPEVYCIVRSREGLGEANIVGFASYRNRSYGEIYVPPFPEGSPYMKGYKGGDFYVLENKRILREFPIFQGGQDTGKKRRIIYELQRGETSFVLKATGQEEI